MLNNEILQLLESYLSSLIWCKSSVDIDHRMIRYGVYSCSTSNPCDADRRTTTLLVRTPQCQDVMLISIDRADDFGHGTDGILALFRSGTVRRAAMYMTAPAKYTFVRDYDIQLRWLGNDRCTRTQ